MPDAPRENDDSIVVDPASIELDAWWDKEAPAWRRIALWCLTRVRHQTASIGMGAIVAVPWLVGARADDIGILSVAMGFIAAIAVSVAWIDGKYYGNDRRKGTAELGHAFQDKATDR